MNTQPFRRRDVGIAIAASFSLLCGFAGCSTAPDGFELRGPSFDSDASAGVATDAGCTTTRCSRDLKSVRSGCTGELVETCDRGLGCGEGRCVSACEAASISKGSTGCGFWAVPPDDVIENSAGSCFAALLSNTWDVAANVSVEYGATALDASKSLYTVTTDMDGKVRHTRLDGPIPPGGVAVVFLAGQADALSPCPADVTPLVTTDPVVHGTSRFAAFHVRTDMPISAYAMYPYGGARAAFPSATLLLPESSWTTSYLAVNARAPIGKTTLSFTQFVAADDDTLVRMQPLVDVMGGLDVVPAARGFVQSWTLKKGEVLQLTQYEELTGSAIETSKPIGLFGGSRCTNVPEIGTGWCDILSQQIAPVAQWGHAYALVPYRSRRGFGDKVDDLTHENVPWRLVGAVDGTELTYDPAPPTGAPTRLAAGQVADFTSTEIVSVRSQDSEHPFYAAEYMTGEIYSSIKLGRNLGDPDFVNLVPSDQFLDHYVLFADHSFAETSFTVVRRANAGTFHPVTLSCAGELGDFHPVGTSGEYEYTWLRITKDHAPVAFGSGSCGYGRHELTSDGPFAVYVWGMDDAASYGYAGGAGLRALTTIPPRLPN
ncbi:hypothetical protein AKJ09_02352 [Labilithrix luteola]|uniref:IgGFc-binding protein N-terminal domain-containing protein n=1 Tax=Labilithrix luteola TaxID=1391654 RepID=A0A0K1PQ81_9BACT|nr:IgGFc-binding protein [Labilithrix luteola]AKU95688.1 hypothetical protein AKJ09_02352 [Labilithrix luteola]